MCQKDFKNAGKTFSNILNNIKVEELSPPSLFQKACMYDYLNLYCFLSMNQGSIVVSRYAQQL